MNINPYAAPKTITLGTNFVVRDKLSDLIKSFVEYRIDEEALITELSQLQRSGDRLVEYVIETVWEWTDGTTRPRETLTKKQWDYIQRLLLALQSDCYLEEQYSRHWSVKQVVAGLFLCGFGVAWLNSGWSTQTFIASAICGFISLLIGLREQNTFQSAQPYHSVISPFRSFTDLDRAYRQGVFRKMRYRPSQHTKADDTPPDFSLQDLMGYVIWIFYGPMVLIFQCLPEVKVQYEVRATTMLENAG